MHLQIVLQQGGTITDGSTGHKLELCYATYLCDNKYGVTKGMVTLHCDVGDQLCVITPSVIVPPHYTQLSAAIIIMDCSSHMPG